ncbi:MAG TPA: ABC-2 family transporter protein [Candidatus Saccharimonadales bacterium]|nr:ABC-2 family transporter protein [Candidatus Saccharimonadales bacterium]
MKKYFIIWLTLTSNATQTAFASRAGALIFLLGKFMRFGFFFFFLFIILANTKTLAGYSSQEVFFFYLTFNLIDTIPQMFFREVYRFREQVVSGNFDYYLIRPISILFRSLIGGSDILDVPLTGIIIVLLFVIGAGLPGVTFLSVILYLILLINALLIALAFHIFVVSLGILTTEVDNAIMLYRDLTQMGRFPVDIYKEPLRGVLTFAIPVGIMMTVPAKVLMGIFSWQLLVVSIVVGILFFFISLAFWNHAIREYSSASS